MRNLNIKNQQLDVRVSVTEIIELMSAKARYFGKVRKPNIDYVLEFGDRIAELTKEIRRVEKDR